MRSSSIRNVVLALLFALAGGVTLVATVDAQSAGPCDLCSTMTCPEGMTAGCIADGDSCSCACTPDCEPAVLCETEEETDIE